MQTNQTGRGGQTRNRNTRTHKVSTEPRQGKPQKRLPDFPKNIFGHIGSVHTKEQRATIKRPHTRIQKSSPTSVMEAHMGAYDNGGKQA